jgi:hypothetical protein
MVKCDRCLNEFDKLEKVIYNVKAADGNLEFPAQYCTECADACERIVKSDLHKAPDAT